MSSSQQYGGGGGEPFSMLPADERQTVQRLDVWHAEHEGSLIVSKIQLFWTDGTTQSQGTDTSNPPNTYKFAEDETITQFTIHSGLFVDAISFRTNKMVDEFIAGGRGGTPHNVDVGNGKLRGFGGRSGEDIDALSAYFT